ncbi:MAG: hypothetical protein WKG07_07520 [Hymenobacter sp.]
MTLPDKPLFVAPNKVQDYLLNPGPPGRRGQGAVLLGHRLFAAALRAVGSRLGAARPTAAP